METVTETVVPLEDDSELQTAIVRGTAFEEFQRTNVHRWIKEWMDREVAAYLHEMRDARAINSNEVWAKLMLRWMVAEDMAKSYEAMVKDAVDRKYDALTRLKEKIIEYDIEH